MRSYFSRKRKNSYTFSSICCRGAYAMTKRKLSVLLVLWALPALAQFTTVTGTVIDPNGVPYALGTISPTLVSSASPTLNGLAYSPPTQPVGLDKNGSFSFNLADNAQLLPASSKWNFTVCSAVGTVQPAIGTGSQCFTLAAPITITGATQSITTQLNAVALALTVGTVTGGPFTPGDVVIGGTGGRTTIDSGQSIIPVTSITSFGISTLASGDNALYTVPANKCALLRLFAFNATGGAITVFPTITPSGGATIYRIGANVALAASGTTGSDTNYQFQTYLIFNPGDVVGLNATALGVNAHGVVLLFDLNNPNTFKQVMLKTFAVGDNTVYTVPVGKVAYLGYGSFTPVGLTGTQTLYSNESGGNATISFNVVPSGGSVAASNRIYAPSVVANNIAVAPNFVKKMSAGDFLSINSTSAGKQFFTCFVLEATQ